LIVLTLATQFQQSHPCSADLRANAEIEDHEPPFIAGVAVGFDIHLKRLPLYETAARGMANIKSAPLATATVSRSANTV
jgi:hypothetical protein